MSDYNASDTRHIRRAAKAARQAASERGSVILSLMSTPAGRSWMHDRLARCHVFSSSFSQSALSTAFAEGERNVGLQDLNDIMAFAPDQYVQMMREANDRNQANVRRDSGSGQPAGDRSDLGRDDSGSSDEGGYVESEYEPGSIDRLGED